MDKRTNWDHRIEGKYYKDKNFEMSNNFSENDG